MSEFTFVPSKDYDELLKQANAMALLIRSMEKQKAFQNVKFEYAIENLKLLSDEGEL